MVLGIVRTLGRRRDSIVVGRLLGSALFGRRLRDGSGLDAVLARAVGVGGVCMGRLVGTVLAVLGGGLGGVGCSVNDGHGSAECEWRSCKLRGQNGSELMTSDW